MDVENAVPLSTSERMSRQMTVLRVANGLMAEHDGWHRLSILDIANAAVDVLIEDATLMPSERWDEECHRCEQRIGDHLVDGRCPVVLVEDRPPPSEGLPLTAGSDPFPTFRRLWRSYRGQVGERRG